MEASLRPIMYCWCDLWRVKAAEEVVLLDCFLPLNLDTFMLFSCKCQLLVATHHDGTALWA